MSLTSSMLLDRRYELEERIGTGGFSEVWRATDLVLARRVAIKMLHPGHATDAQVRERFRAEARHAGCLAHENIARVYDYGEPGPPQRPFLVMELVPGPSLAQVLAAGALNPARGMHIVAQAAAGLHAAHAAGLVHRDIKPGNLLLAPDDMVKITDFGIAHALGSAPVTGTGIVIGTPGYLAPERAAGSRGTPASDLYALGVVAHECLAGPGSSAGGSPDPAPAGDDRTLPPLPASVPAAAAVLVMELTARDPAARPSAAEVARRAGEMAGRASGVTGRASGVTGRASAETGRASAVTGRAAGDVPGRAAVTAARAAAFAPEAPAAPRAGGPAPGEPTPTRSLPLLPPPGRHVARARRARRAAVAAAVLVAVVTGLALASVIGDAPGRPAPVRSSSTVGPKPAAVRPSVTVGRPHGSHRPAGPGDRQGHGRGHGDGQGDGNGNGDGSGQG